MVKRKYEVTLYSYGKYEKWDRESKEIPKLISICQTVTTSLDTEFGYVLRIKRAKGKQISYCIDHPPFCDEAGEIMPSFIGELFINNNDFQFFLGDCIWEPIFDKFGDWKLTTWIEGEKVAEKVLKIVPYEEGREK